MKKIIAMLLALILVLGLVACGEQAPTTGGDTTEPGATSGGSTQVDADGTVKTEYAVAADEVKTDKEIKPFKILVTYAQFTDKLGSQFKSSVEYLAKPLNLELVFVEAGMDADAGMTALQGALAGGDFDGCIGLTATEAYVKMFDDAGVPYVLSGGGPSDPEWAATIAKYENYMGAIMVDDYQAGYEMAEALYQRGCRNVMWNGLPLGMAGQHDDRTRGFKDGVAAHEADGMKLIAENLDYMAWADGIANTAANFPELDGVGCSALTEQVYNTVESEGLIGQVLLAGIDITEGTGAAFEKGSLAYISGGNYAHEQLCMAVLLNYLYDGTRLIPDSAKNMMQNNINLYSVEDFNNYVKFFDSAVPAWTPQEIVDMIHYFNPEVDDTTLETACKTYTLENVMERHAEFFK